MNERSDSKWTAWAQISRAVIFFIGALKDLVLILGSFVIQAARIKQKQAEDREALTKTELDIERKVNEIDRSNIGKSNVDIIRDHLKRTNTKKES